mgnify:CR=1 FL=1|jgi:hypothetical protein
MADHSHSTHQHGSMDIRVQERTFAGFVRWITWSVVVILFVLILLALSNA